MTIRLAIRSFQNRLRFNQTEVRVTLMLAIRSFQNRLRFNRFVMRELPHAAIRSFQNRLRFNSDSGVNLAFPRYTFLSKSAKI